MHHQPNRLLSAIIAAWALHGAAHAQLVINDTLTGASSSYNWTSLNGACLTAGNNTGSIPACMGLPYYGATTLVGGVSGRLPDPVGKGALRLTNGDTVSYGSNGISQQGAILSNFTLPSNAGLQVTFRTVIYGGNDYSGRGADGISFFLANGSIPPSLGAVGGGLGYACYNNASTTTIHNGVSQAYLGVGIDAFGNFSNKNLVTNTGVPTEVPNAISLRGAGNTTWASLNARKPIYYPSTLSFNDKSAALAATCKTGKYVNYSGSAIIDANRTRIPNRQTTTESIGNNYPLLGSISLPVTLSNQQAINLPLRDSANAVDYALRITQDGLLDFSYSFNGGAPQVIWSGQSITASNGPLPPSFRFGFAASTGLGSNVHEILCFKAGPLVKSRTSAAANVQQATVKAGTQLYLASYQSLNWWGQLIAQDLLETSTGGLSVRALPNWDASCTLTGGNCPTITPPASPIVTLTADAPASRSILTWSNGTGVALSWASLTAAQKSALSAGDPPLTAAALGNNRVQYLRGDRSNEGGTVFRSRTGVLGDIVDSSPTWVGPPNQRYRGTKDQLYPAATAPEASGQTYDAFKTANATRQHLVFVGANDGLMHAFKAGVNDASGNFINNSVTKPNNGREALAYMPSLVMDTIHSPTAVLDYTHIRYGHNFYANASPGSGDLYYNGAWHTWLVSGLGAGGNAAGPIADKTSPAKGALFALDVTTPSNFSEANAASLVIGDWTSDNLTCTNSTTCATNLGSVYGTPLIRRLHNGQWAAIFGNGLNSSAGTAGIFIMLVDPTTGNTSFRFLDTGAGAVAGDKNGIVNVASADLDFDNITDYIYAGDVMGNLWRFDLTDSNPNSWAAGSQAVFKTASGQPITSKPVIAITPGTGTESRPRLIIAFGTGQRFPQTSTADITYASGSQALYGIWDSNMADWNTKGSAPYASIASASTVNASDLLAQSVTSTNTGNNLTLNERQVSKLSMCWKASALCPVASDNKHLGWTLPLPGTNEQAFYSPALEGQYFVINTTIPGNTGQDANCSVPPPPTGYTLGISIIDGGATDRALFTTTTTAAKVSGIGIGATGTPMFIRTSKGKKFAVNQSMRSGSPSGSSTTTDEGFADCNSDGRCSNANRVIDELGNGKRLNWSQLR
jgi:type IV pilus assembly protein PilY1